MVLVTRPLRDSRFKNSPALQADMIINNTVTLADIDGLAIDLEANKTYRITGLLSCDGLGTADIKFGWTTPTVTAFPVSFWNDGFSDSTPLGNISWDTNANTPLSGVGSEKTVNIHGLINTTAAGTIQMRAAQQTNQVGDTTIHKGAFIRAEEIDLGAL